MLKDREFRIKIFESQRNIVFTTWIFSNDSEEVHKLNSQDHNPLQLASDCPRFTLSAHGKWNFSVSSCTHDNTNKVFIPEFMLIKMLSNLLNLK